MSGEPSTGDTGVSAEAEARARAEVALQRLPPRVQHRLARLLSRWPGRVVIRSAVSAARLGIFDRSMTLAAQFFTSVLPILILVATWAAARDTRRLADLISLPEQSRSVIDNAVAGAGGAAFSVVGALMVLVSATSLSRAMIRAFATIWEVDRPRSTISSVWRWLAAVVAMAAALVAARALIAAAAELPPATLWRALASLTCDLAVAVFVPWVLLHGSVRPRVLVPGALVFALLMLMIRPAAAVWLPWALETSADHYGPIGVAFTYLAWLYVAAFVFLATAVLGHTIAVDRGGLGRWISGSSSPRRDAAPHPGTAP